MAKSKNIFEHQGHITRDMRAVSLGHKSTCIWLTGLSGSGKSTIAVALEKELFKQGKLVYRLDGDNMRFGINSNLGFSPEDRTENIRRVSEVAKLLCDLGVIVISSFISPYVADRKQARSLHEEAGFDFIEVYVQCALAIVEERDPKGLYKKARAGEIPEFTGISAPYEKPEQAEIVLNTGEMSLPDEVKSILSAMHKRGII